MEVKINNGEYENMSFFLIGGSNLGFLDMGGFKLIYKLLIFLKNIICRYLIVEFLIDLVDE